MLPQAILREYLNKHTTHKHWERERGRGRGGREGEGKPPYYTNYTVPLKVYLHHNTILHSSCTMCNYNMLQYRGRGRCRTEIEIEIGIGRQNYTILYYTTQRKLTVYSLHYTPLYSSNKRKHNHNYNQQQLSLTLTTDDVIIDIYRSILIGKCGLC